MSHVSANCCFSIPFVFILRTLYVMHRLGLENESHFRDPDLTGVGVIISLQVPLPSSLAGVNISPASTDGLDVSATG